MKKIIFNIIAIAALTIGFNACTDLDMPSDGSVELPDVFAQRNTIEGYYNQLVNEIPQIGMTYYSGQYLTFLASFCDEAEDVNNRSSGATYSWYTGGTTSAYNPLNDGLAGNYGSYNNAWNYYYPVIRRCNTFLQQIPDATAGDLNEAEVAGWVAQIQVLRAFSYLQLMKRYGGAALMDTPYETDHDYSQDRRASVEEIADFIIAQCDLALATPEAASSDIGFRWDMKDDQRGKISRAFAYAVKSQTALFAASPLFYEAGSKYTWDKATDITKEALDQCLSHGYALYNRTMNDAMNAKTLNIYGYYFIQRSDPSHVQDKETIFESTTQRASVWQYASLPTWPGGINAGGVSAGSCPSQELVDAYETTDGQPVLNLNNPYSDADHLQPNYNPANTLYDRNDPYANRDPRFYASIYYNGALRKWKKGESQYLNPKFNRNFVGGMTAVTVSDTTTITTTGANSYIETGYLGGSINYDEAYLVFDYISDRAIEDAYFYVATGTTAMPNSTMKSVAITLPKAETWTSYKYDLRDFMNDYGFGVSTINGQQPRNHRIGFNPSLSEIGLNIKISGWKIEMATPPVALASVETYIGGNSAISDNVTNLRNTRTGYYLRKFNSAQSETGAEDDGYVKMFRLGELYLNFAEAAYNAGTPDAKHGDLSARDAVNTVRARAGMPELPEGLSKEDFEKRYRNERRVELAFEEHRFFDVRRWKIIGETDGFVTGMKITQNEDGTFNYERVKMVNRATAAEKYLLFPIPQTEVAKIREYTGTNWQNPGWD
ncbi:MAG: RagB/SusD family nutrient uptake outer membrane protein [Candidatus Symbiothrix sp.]|jgi:hypothetical protein|nr:RagB/SusD family nutrient uptake outer membrane protein [Candidatus Symbiothrix sp.]